MHMDPSFTLKTQPQKLTNDECHKYFYTYEILTIIYSFTKYFSSFPFPFLDYQILLISCCVKYEIKSGNDENPQNKFLTISFNQPNF